MKHQFYSSVAGAALALFTASYSATAHAQEADADPDASVTEAETAPSVNVTEIIVTAQKREQRLSDVPISVSAASAETLQSAGVVDAGDLGAVVPGFTASTSVFGPPVFSLRGVNFNSFQASAPPAVSSYIDEAAIPYPVMGQALFLDVERVEVLKGPQGTLFGQNATGGSINVVAAKPTDILEVGMRVDVNHWGETFVEGFISGPLTDTLRARVAVQTSQFGGWQRGYFRNDQENGDQNRMAGRLLLDWTPTDRLTIGLNINGSYDRSEQQQAQAFLFTPVNPAAPSAAPFLDYVGNEPNDARDADFDLGYDTRADSRTFQAVLRADYELTNSLTFTSITNYIDTRFRSPHDQDGTAVPMQPALAKADIESFNQEVRLSGDLIDAGVTFVVGASYADDDITEGVANDYIGYTGFPPNSPAEWIYDLTQKAKAVFGNVDFEILEGLTISAGARYTDTEQSIYGCTFDRGGTPGIRAIPQSIVSAIDPTLAAAYVAGGCITIDDGPPNPTFLPVFADRQQNEDNVAWRGVLSYEPTDAVLLYGSVSRGYCPPSAPMAQI